MCCVCSVAAYRVFSSFVSRLQFVSLLCLWIHRRWRLCLACIHFTRPVETLAACPSCNCKEVLQSRRGSHGWCVLRLLMMETSRYVAFIVSLRLYGPSSDGCSRSKNEHELSHGRRWWWRREPDWHFPVQYWMVVICSAISAHYY